MTVHITVKGNVESRKTLIFIHGWPDTEAVFDQQVAFFERDFRIVLLTLPGYRSNDQVPLFGVDMHDVIKQLTAAVKGAMSGRSEKPILIMHDWGAVLGHALLIDNPTLVERCVFLDIGCHIKLNLKGVIFALVYQLTLLFLFLLPSFIGTPLTKVVAKLLGVPAAARAKMHAGMNYLYLQSWKRRVTMTQHPAYTGWHPPAVPVLYMYGTKKPLYFHSKRWLQHLDSTPGSKQLSFAGGHWFFIGKLAPAVNAEIAKFVAS